METKFLDSQALTARFVLSAMHRRRGDPIPRSRGFVQLSIKSSAPSPPQSKHLLLQRSHCSTHDSRILNHATSGRNPLQEFPCNWELHLVDWLQLRVQITLLRLRKCRKSSIGCRPCNYYPTVRFRGKVII